MSHNRRVILGIDPGSRCTGYGVIALHQNKIICQDYGQIATRGDSLPQRLKEIYDGLLRVVDTHQPSEAAIEQIFTCRNPQSALKLGHARGAAMLAVNHLPLGEYSPRTIKKNMVGYGNADKAQMQHMVRALLGLNATPPTDAADALAIAWCHAHCHNTPIEKYKDANQ